jgi:hypothetical protein
MLRPALGAVLAVLATALAVFLLHVGAKSRYGSGPVRFSDVGAVIAADAPIVIKPSDPNLFYIGRWKDGTDPSFKTFDWGGSTIRMRITGTRTLGVALLVCGKAVEVLPLWQHSFTGPPQSPLLFTPRRPTPCTQSRPCPAPPPTHNNKVTGGCM